MNKLLTLLLLSLSISSFGQAMFVPKEYEVITEKIGDLDKDGIDEKVIVYETDDTTAYGNVRVIQILKQAKGKWVEWRKSSNAILKFNEGGMMGDPFQGIEIEKGILIINFSGGSSWKWFHEDKYRFQNNEFELIGYTSVFGKLCEYWGFFDFNISTGRVVYSKEFEDCERDQEIYKIEKENFYKKGIKINLKNRKTGAMKITSPIHKYELYL